MKRVAVLLAAGLWIVGCGGGAGTSDANRDANSKGGVARPASHSGGGGAVSIGLDKPADGVVREAAVSGAFYASDANQLARGVDQLLAQSVAAAPGPVRGLICPHAGYVFSGLTAAVGHKQLMGADVQTVILLASSHTATYSGAAIPAVKAFRTPLGPVLLSPKAAALADKPPFSSTPKADVQRPGGWETAPKAAPAVGKDTPHTWDHTIEVQLPFLQRTLKDFQIIPILFGEVDPAAVAEALLPVLDDKTVIVVSSDLSHYKTDEVARAVDGCCVQAVREMDVKAMAQQEACGKGPILTLMHIAKARNWKPIFLGYSNSGDVKNGDKSRVVGYMAFAFVEEGQAKDEPLDEQEKAFLLKAARIAATAAAEKKPLPGLNRSSMPRKLLVPRGAFTTLNLDGKLRGCVGYTLPVKPLCQAVMETAALATVNDNRFKPVTPEELAKCEVDISVLTTPKGIYYNEPSDLLKKLRPNIDGVVLQVDNRQGVYLPAVWKEVPEPDKFMDSLARKAGLPADAWRHPSAQVLIFQAEEFKESAAASQPAAAATQPAAKG
jgi:hypothetical protein